MTQFKKANDEIREIAAKLATFQSQPLQDLQENSVRQCLTTLQSHSAGMTKLEQKASEKDPNKQIYNSAMITNILNLKAVFDQTLQECTALYEKVKVVEQERAKNRALEEERARAQARLKAEAEERERAQIAEAARQKALAEEQERVKAQEAEKSRREAEEVAKKEKEAAAKAATPASTSTEQPAVRVHIGGSVEPATLEEAARAIDALKDRKAPQDEVKAAVQTYLTIKERTGATTQQQPVTATHNAQQEAAEQARKLEEEKKKAEEARKAEETRKLEESRKAEEARRAEEARKIAAAAEAKRAEDAKKAKEEAQKVEAQRAAAQRTQSQQEDAKKVEEAERQGQKRKLEASTQPELAALELEDGLKTLSSNSSREEYSTIVNSLLGYVSNITAAPMDTRFHKIKVHALLQRPGGAESLAAIGFKKYGETPEQFELTPSAGGWPILVNAKKILERAKAKPQEERKQPPTSTPAQSTQPPQARPAQSQAQLPNLSTLLQGLLNNPAAGGGANLGAAVQQLMNPQNMQSLQNVLGSLGGLAPATPTTSRPASSQSTSTQTTTATPTPAPASTPAATVAPPASTSAASTTQTSTATASTTTATTTRATTAPFPADDLALSEEEMIAEAIRMSMEEEHSK